MFEQNYVPLFEEHFDHDLVIQKLPTTPHAAAKLRFALPLLADGGDTGVRRTDAITHGLSGFGRRNSLLVIYVAAVVLANKTLLNSKGLKLHFTIFEMQEEKEAGSGYSCQTTCDGALNTGIPTMVTIPKVTDTDLPASDIKDLMDLAQTITAELEKNIDEHKTVLKEENLAALELFVKAIDAAGKKISPKEAFTTRGAIGRIQQPKIENALAYIDANMKDMITIDRRFGQVVSELILTNPQKPKLMVHTIRNPTVVVPYEFDFVHMSNGTPWAPPVTPGPMVTAAIPNHDDVRRFLADNNLLDSSGQIKTTAKIGVAGLSLSAYDYVPLVLRYTSIIEPTDTGYKISEANAKHYPGLLTFVSHSGVPAPPRHVDPKHFTIPAGLRLILTTEEVHTLLLQKKFDWLSFWKVFLDANVARFLGKLPKDLQYRKTMDTKQRMVDYARQNRDYMQHKQTEVGLQRSGYWLVYGGQGFYADPTQAEQELVAKAPLTRKERAGFLMRRGSLAEVTSAAYLAVSSNKAFFNEYTVMHNCVTASPPAIQRLVARMFELGVAKFVPGSFEDDVLKLVGKGVVFFAPKLLDRKNNLLLMSLKGKVEEVVLGHTKGRFIRTQKETAPVHVIDMGMGGQGTTVKRFKDGDSIIGMQWPDTSFLDAAADSAANMAPVTVLLSTMTQEGIQKPAEHLLKEYDAGLPSEEEFDKEVEQFRPTWKEVHEKRAFLLLCESVATDALQYLEYSDKVFDSQTRKALVDDWVQNKLHGNAIDIYSQAIKEIPEFDPPSATEYFERFVDFSPSEITKFPIESVRTGGFMKDTFSNLKRLVLPDQSSDSQGAKGAWMIGSGA
ncbi:hypothetical protein BDP27DRAFT_1425066 [Rhodocollybia butyracea]|uniref:Uncharacterized protein n=1 Tax=Rhodocollybia butyracea TaxID=206335 RepID=A0A9P5PKN1_9AGAR|nr:hypothetical protein BDP27DRAFT_1425066 [Rhodocollybia butyracea]